MTRVYTASDAAKQFGDVLETAAERPVVITRFGRRRAVIVDCGTFQRYQAAYREQVWAAAVERLAQSFADASDNRTGRAGRSRTEAMRLVERMKERMIDDL